MAYRQFKQVPLDDNGTLPEEPLTGARELREFRDDLRPPQLVFGRCTVTGEFGKCIALDLGDISIEAPDATREVSMDPDGTVHFGVWKPWVFQQQLLVSEEGCRRLLAWAQGKDTPIPTITTYLEYAWQLAMKDGSRLCQFSIDPDTGEEVETNTKIVDWSSVSQIDIVSHFPQERVLPKYTFITETGKIYKDEQELDLAYDAPYPAEAHPFYGRRVHHTMGSVMLRRSLNRDIAVQKTTVLQLLGWRVGGLGEGVNPCCLISIDEHGQWRPFEYITQEEADKNRE